MGWTAYYQLLRDRPLDASELAVLHDHVRRCNTPRWEVEGFRLDVPSAARTDRVVARGWTKLPLDVDDSKDHQRLCAALGGLRGLLRGVELRLHDDLGLFGFAGDAVVLPGPRGPALVEDDDAQPGFVPLSTVVPPDPAGLAPEVQALLDGGEPTPEALRATLLALAALRRKDPLEPRLQALLTTMPGLPLVQAALAVYRQIKGTRAWASVGPALARLDDVAPIVDAVLALWREPDGVHGPGDLWQYLRDGLARLAQVAAVEAVMLADVAAGVAGSDKELVHRRAEQAAILLGLGRRPGALLALLEAAQALRAGTLSGAQRHHTQRGVHQGLVHIAAPAVVPTLLLDLDGESRGLASHRGEALGVLARLAPARVVPVLRFLAGSGEELERVIPALQLADDRETLRALCDHPSSRRTEAAQALRALGEEPPVVGEVPAPSTLVTHRVRTIRESALTALEQTNDLTLMTSILAARTLHAAIGQRFGGAVGSYGQYLRQLPPDLRHASHDVQLQAVRAGQVPDLPAQVIWPSVQPILDGDVAALAAGYPSPTLTFDAASAQALRAEEAAIIDALRAGAPAPDPAAGPPVVIAAS